MKAPKDSSERILRTEKIPRTYLTGAEHAAHGGSKEAEPDTISVRFERFLAAMMFASVPVVFRFRSLCGTVHLEYASPGESPNLLTVEAAFQAQFPDFQTGHLLTTWSTAQSPCAVAIVSGVPVRTHEPLNSLAHVMARYQGSAIYQVSAWPVRPTQVSRFVAKQRYRSALERSEHQEASAGFFGGQENRRRVDVDALERSRVHEATYRRLMSDRVLKCQVVLAFWGSPDAATTVRHAVNALLSTISSVDKRQRMQELSAHFYDELVRAEQESSKAMTAGSHRSSFKVGVSESAEHLSSTIGERFRALRSGKSKPGEG